MIPIDDVARSAKVSDQRLEEMRTHIQRSGDGSPDRRRVSDNAVIELCDALQDTRAALRWAGRIVEDLCVVFCDCRVYGDPDNSGDPHSTFCRMARASWDLHKLVRVLPEFKTAAVRPTVPEKETTRE